MELKILFATGFSGYNHGAIVDKLLAKTFMKDGHKVEFFVCDKFLPTCMLTKIKQIKPSELHKIDEQPRCNGCLNSGQKYLKDLPVKINYFSEFLDNDEINKVDILSKSIDIEKIRDYKVNNINIGEEAYAGAIRYFGSEDLSNEDFLDPILRKFFKSALLSYFSFLNVSQNKYDRIIFSHGVYVPHGIINKICKVKKIPTYIYIPSYRKNTFLFSQNDTYHKTMVNEVNCDWNNFEFTKKKNDLITEYLESRKTGINDWIFFNKENKFETSSVIKKNKKNVVLLTNVIWDARLHFASSAFHSMEEWIISTIKYYKDKEDFNLIIRVHPAEVTGDVPSRQSVIDIISKNFITAPKNIQIIAPDNPISTYSLIENANLVLIYSTKTGIEAAAMKKQVVVAGEAWARNKGFTYDATSPENYIETLNNINYDQDLENEKFFLAKKYAYYLFFRRMIRLDQIKLKIKGSKQIFKINNNINESDDVLKTISKQIYDVKKIIYDDENFKPFSKINFFHKLKRRLKLVFGA